MKGRCLILDCTNQDKTGRKTEQLYPKKASSILQPARSRSRQAGSALGLEGEEGGELVGSPLLEIFGRARVGNSAAFIPRRHSGRQPAADMWHGEREQQWGTPTSAGLSQSGDGAIVCGGWCSRCGGLETCRNPLFFPPLAFVYYNTSLKEAQKYPAGSFSRAISARCIQSEAEKGSVANPSPYGFPIAPEHPCPLARVERWLQCPARGPAAPGSDGELFCQRLLFPLRTGLEPG